MLIVAIGHYDVFTCSCTAKPEEVDHTKVDQVLQCVMRKQKLAAENIDELLVIRDDNVIAHYELG